MATSPGVRLSSGKRVAPTRHGKFRCPECGFVAKHVQGLGRHRTSIHGVASKRSLRDQERTSKPTTDDAALGETLLRIETKLDQLISTATQARTSRSWRRRQGR